MTRMGTKELRKRSGLTQGQVAIAIGSSREAVENWDQKRVSPSLRFAIRLTRLFNCELEELLSKDET